MREGIDTAVIMAGGQGMRLRPYTTVLPKPIMPLGDTPLLEILIRQLGAAGIRNVLISVNHLSHIIKAVLDHTDFSDMEVNIEYHHETRPLGTCGSLTLMRGCLPERFLVVNGDLFSDYPIRSFIEKHAESDAALTIGTRIRTEAMNFGVVQRDPDGAVSDYVEKPATDYESSIGLYALERRCIDDYLTPDTRTDMPELVQALLANGREVQGVPAACTWIDIGQPETYLRAQELFERMPSSFLKHCGEDGL